MSPRRLLTCAVALAALALTRERLWRRHRRAGSCAARAPAGVEYLDSVLSFRHPAAWKVYPFRWDGELHFRPLVYLSTQPVHDPCAMRGNAVFLRLPSSNGFSPGGVPGHLERRNPPAVGLGQGGSRIRVEGHPARRVDTAGGMCRSIGADRTIDVLVQTRPLPSPLTEFTACLRGPGLAQAEKSVDALLASTKFRSS